MAVESIRVYINGEPHQVPAQQSVAGLLHELSVPAERVAIELNKTIVRKTFDWGHYRREAAMKERNSKSSSS